VKAPAAQPKIRRKRSRIFSLFFMSVGIGILIWVAWPILSFSAFKEQLLTATIAPIDETAKMVTSSPLSSVAYAAAGPEKMVADSATDFTNVNAWYPAAPQKHEKSTVNSYTLSIPKLKIKEALVTIGGDDLNSSLIHYGGTGIPGQYGGAVVFGHSTLPQFYSPTSYRSIFSLLPTLKEGDDIFLNYDGVEYRYTIYLMVVIDPTDLSVLEQRFDNSYLTLVTCVPPGTYWKRLNVHAKLNTL
jgi:sortase A